MQPPGLLNRAPSGRCAIPFPTPVIRRPSSLRMMPHVAAMEKGRGKEERQKWAPCMPSLRRPRPKSEPIEWDALDPRNRSDIPSSRHSTFWRRTQSTVICQCVVPRCRSYHSRGLARLHGQGSSCAPTAKKTCQASSAASGHVLESAPGGCDACHGPWLMGALHAGAKPRAIDAPIHHRPWHPTGGRAHGGERL